MNVLSLFDGMSCGRIALDKANIKYDNYFASEIDKHSISVSIKNYPTTIQLGSVLDLDTSKLDKIDLLIGGSPCTNFSVAGKGNGMITTDNQELLSLDDYLELKQKGFQFKGQSYLFWEYVRILRETKPKYFLLENVKMKKKWEDLISNELGVKPVLINSNLFSAQNRQRLYWTNIELNDEIVDKGIKLKDILDQNVDKSLYLSDDEIVRAQFKKSKKSIPRVKNGFEYFFNEGSIQFPNSIEKKSQCLLAAGQGISRTTTYVDNGNGIRKLSPVECERLQNVPENYTDNVSNSQRYKMLGNGWTVDVIAYIFSKIK